MKNARIVFDLEVPDDDTAEDWAKGIQSLCDKNGLPAKVSVSFEPELIGVRVVTPGGVKSRIHGLADSWRTPYSGGQLTVTRKGLPVAEYPKDRWASVELVYGHVPSGE